LRTRNAEDRLLSSLSSIDWNFAASTTLPTSIHSIHWFPGNFIRQIPAFLIQLLSTPGALVLDPFAGSYTTGVEASLLGRNALGCDVNLVSAIIGRAKIALVQSAAVRTYFPRLSQSLDWNFSPFYEGIGLRGEGTDLELSSWFHPATLIQLKSIWKQIESMEDADVRAVLVALFSDTLLYCASTGRSKTSGGAKRRNHWGWIADNVQPKMLLRHDAQRRFIQALRRTNDILQATPLIDQSNCSFVQSDARSLCVLDDSVDLIVTSPPYLGMIDYAAANRLTYLWFGKSIKEERTREIGARYRRNKKDEANRYLGDMRLTVGEIFRVLKPGGFCAIVFGASRKFPEMPKELNRLFAECLRQIWGPSPRIPSRRRVAARQSVDPLEYVSVFTKDY
jgi:hypothetical protein